ncbi:NAD(P)-dependent oxidoreductase [Neobacillus sp. LXY-4]|uniref:NAD(P)-dependent oxidoreductase n=1 Tax=Neobacillus sp. LXY-4 TaxID=3379826 RepID=UPI003EDF805E
MNVCIFGASGRVGSIILRKALEDGHQVQALIRNSSNIPFSHANLRWVVGNALNETDINEAIGGTSMVICSLNTDGNSTLSTSMPLIINAMKQHNITRIVTIGTAGILQSRLEPKLYRFQSSESRNRSTKAAEDHLNAFLQLRKSNLNWTIVCPTYLPDGEPTGVYRIEKDLLPLNGLSISTADTADFAYKQLCSDEFSQCRVGLAY